MFTFRVFDQLKKLGNQAIDCSTDISHQSNKNYCHTFLFFVALLNDPKTLNRIS